MAYNHFQKQTDKGWQSMSALLDRKMPQRRRRRVLAWWWLTGLLIPFAGLISWWWLNESSDRQPEQNNHTPKDASIADVAASSGWNIAIDGRSTTVQLPGQTQVSDHLRPNVLRGAEPMDFVGVLEAPIFPADLEPLVKAEIQEDGSTKTLSFITADPFVHLPASTSQALEGHEYQPDVFCPLFQPVFIPAKKRVKKPSNNVQKWQVSASLGLSSERFTAVNSVLTGLTIDWQPLRHWGLRSGLMYEYYKPSGIARPIAEVDAMAYADATRNHAFLHNNGVYVPGTSEALGLDVALPVTLMNRLRAPLLAYWEPLRWMRVYSGASFGYTLGAKTSNKGLAFDNELVASRSSASAYRVNKLATKELPRWQVHLQGGMGLKLGKRCEIGLTYQQSAKMQFKSLFDKRQEEGQLSSDQNRKISSRPNHHFFTLSGAWLF